MAIPFEVGKTYHRKTDLHGPFGGSYQSGISPCAAHPYIFLFTAPTGEQHGYVDEFHNGLFWYTGAGQVGDMTFDRGNQAIKEHIEKQKHLLLFEMEQKGYYRYMGEAMYTGHHIERRLDSNNEWRNAIVFELALEPLEKAKVPIGTEVAPKDIDKVLSHASLEQLKAMALSGASDQLSPKSITTKTYIRSEAIRRYALARANGICEACDSQAPFLTIKGRPYLEVHHTSRVADGGPDHPDKVAALCPNCHRNIHFGKERAKLTGLLLQKIIKLT